jgi:hypothetical protein
MDYKVKISLLLATTIEAFKNNATMQKSLREQLAVAAFLTKADYEKVDLQYASARRRLLATGVAVNATISVADKTAADKAVTGLTEANINSLLSTAGLPKATVTTPASVTATVIPTGAPSTTPSSAPLARAPWPALALLAAAVAAAFAAPVRA